MSWCMCELVCNISAADRTSRSNSKVFMHLVTTQMVLTWLAAGKAGVLEEELHAS